MKNVPKRIQENVIGNRGIDMKGVGQIKGYDFNKGLNYEELFASFKNMGF